MTTLIVVVVVLLIAWIFGSQLLAWMICGKDASDDEVIGIWAGVFIIGTMIFPVAFGWMVYRFFIYPITRTDPDVDDLVP